jgi:uncharacterized protein (DUF2147 family)
MRRKAFVTTGLALAALLLAPHANAQNDAAVTEEPATVAPVEGEWLSATGESRYRMALCGEGEDLCGTLTWLRDDVLNDETRPLLGRTMLDQARPIGDDRWAGTVSLLGHSLSGEVALVEDDRMSITGCVYWVVCRTYYLDKLPD